MKKFLSQLRFTLLRLLLTQSAKYSQDESISSAMLIHSTRMPIDVLNESRERMLRRMTDALIRDGFLEVEEFNTPSQDARIIRMKLHVFKP